MTNEQREKCGQIIHTASLAAAGSGAGLAQLPGADAALLLPIQIGMIVGLGQVFGVKVTDAAAKTLALAATGVLTGRSLSQVIIGWIPGVGNVMNAVTAAGITEAIGWTVAKRFASGELDPPATKSTTAGVTDQIRRSRRIPVRVAIEADNPHVEAEVLKAVQMVIASIGFEDDDAAA